MLFLFPPDPFFPKCPDEMFKDQFQAFQKAGFNVTLQLSGSETVIYRGWMLTPEEYAKEFLGKPMLTSPQEYKAAHHLPEWYETIKDLTPKTFFFSPDGTGLESFFINNPGVYFIKDFVKSQGPNSIVSTYQEAQNLMSRMLDYRDIIEGGLCVRVFEDFKIETETRFFVLRGKVHAPKDTPLEALQLAEQCAQRFTLPFFSIDVIRRAVDGCYRVVEIGDGQVSDLKGTWTVTDFVEIFNHARF
jgi:hypothetical protein